MVRCQCGPPDWVELRTKLMRLLQDEAELEEIVQLVGMDALSSPDRLKLEAARSIREDFLHQNAFDEVDTYTSLEKQHDMMLLIVQYYEKAQAALSGGMDIETLISLPVREQIGRFKYTDPDQVRKPSSRYPARSTRKFMTLRRKKGGLLMPKEYRTIQEVAGPLMLVRNVEGVTYDELAEIELFSGKNAAARC